MGGLMFPKPGPKVRRGPKRMQQKTPLRRLTRLNPRRVKPRRGPWRSKEYRAQVRTLPCCAPRAPRGCSGAIEASHLDFGEEKGMGMKAGDQRCVPHCHQHNQQWPSNGVWREMTRAQLEVYMDEAIHETQVTLGLRGAA